MVDVKELFLGSYQIVAIMDGDVCPTEDFIVNGEETTRASREGLYKMLSDTSKNGLDGIPSAWIHEANKKNGIYEYVKGPLRLFFFKGAGKQIVVCTVGGRKNGNKADKPSVNISKQYRDAYLHALKTNTLRVIK